MNIVERAVWIIETELNSQLSLKSIADRCAVTHFHLSRVFRSTTGMPLMAYLRARRLSEAAKVLAQGEADILNVALDFHYSSHEAFTRAFSAYLGVLPRTVREGYCVDQLNILERFVMDTSLLVDLDPPEFRHRNSFSVTGLSRRYTFEKNFGIPAQWQLLDQRYEEFSQLVSDAAYGICYDADTEGRFSYLSGFETTKDHVTPADMSKVTIPSGKYAVYVHKGHISDFRKTNYTVWNRAIAADELKHRRAPDFEVYDERFDASTGMGVVEIWIPIM